MAPPSLLEKNLAQWQYKRPKFLPQKGVKKLAIKWNKRGNSFRAATRFSIVIDNTAIFPEGIPAGQWVNVDVSPANGPCQGRTTIGLFQKKPGSLVTSRRRQVARSRARPFSRA